MPDLIDIIYLSILIYVGYRVWKLYRKWHTIPHQCFTCLYAETGDEDACLWFSTKVDITKVKDCPVWEPDEGVM